MLSETNIQKTMTEAEIFVQQMELNFKTWRNKRRGSDSLAYERHIISNTVRGARRRMERTLRIEQNFAFLTPIPRWREIMATVVICFQF